MKVDVKIELLKFCFAVLNSIFVALGLSVAGCAVWILFDQDNFLSVLPSDELRTVGAGLLVSGGLVLAISIVGCVGAQRENRFLLLTNVAFLIVLVLGQLFLTLLLLINRRQIGESLDLAVDDIIKTFGQGGSRDRLMDNLQHYGRCCGRMGPADWLKNSFIQSLNLTRPEVLPCSCFTFYRPSLNSSWCSDVSVIAVSLGQGNGSYTQGCGEKLSDWLQENAVTIVGMDLSLILIQVLQLVLAGFLYRTIGQRSALKRSTSVISSDPANQGPTPINEPDCGEQNYSYIDSEDYGYTDPARPGYYRDDPVDVDPAYLPYHHDNHAH
ncbi:CD82 antigen [Genypterus blacodes]|uniref:CD82 antigen n=1 Tax=Genypterus blacodes TaxID=154954 RepID=UPI003F75C580